MWVLIRMGQIYYYTDWATNDHATDRDTENP